ncbi:hypothetical protein [Aliarcobacter butzleri]|uniref:hypothetical protein n=1 Tax=Aliarcobacter butzleri TaxID=28197 RepID=UPI001EDB9ED6|nr:hypothetical protein [Aliarcobacter butzleri]MCG3657928.1 hypothetical protein [Aliarcobacter butzleri]
MEDDLEIKKSKYMNKIETVEDAQKSIEKGIFYKHNKIEEFFYNKFVNLRRKIHHIIGEDGEKDPFIYQVFVDSILIDCRSIFLENDKHPFNYTLQNTYRARGLPEYADEIDKYFNEIIKNNKTLKSIIKDYVDKQLAHYEYLDENKEIIINENISLILDRTNIDNIFLNILSIANQYEKLRKLYGKNSQEQFDNVLKILSSSSNDES